MNNKKRKKLYNIINMLDQTREQVEQLSREEEDSLINLPENLENSSLYSSIEDAVDNLQEAIEKIEEAKQFIEEASV